MRIRSKPPALLLLDEMRSRGYTRGSREVPRRRPAHHNRKPRVRTSCRSKCKTTSPHPDLQVRERARKTQRRQREIYYTIPKKGKSATMVSVHTDRKFGINKPTPRQMPRPKIGFLPVSNGIWCSQSGTRVGRPHSEASYDPSDVSSNASCFTSCPHAVAPSPRVDLIR